MRRRKVRWPHIVRFGETRKPPAGWTHWKMVDTSRRPPYDLRWGIQRERISNANVHNGVHDQSGYHYVYWKE